MPFRPHAHRRPPNSLSGLKGVIFQKNARFELKKPWKSYIRKNGLQDAKKRTFINADESLKAVFNGKKQVSMFEMTKLVSGHLKK